MVFGNDKKKKMEFRCLAEKSRICELSDSLYKIGLCAKVKCEAVSKTETEIILNAIRVHSKDAISSDDSESVTDIKEKGFYNNDKT